MTIFLASIAGFWGGFFSSQVLKAQSAFAENKENYEKVLKAGVFELVSEDGRIEGDVRVPNLVLNGAVEGDVYASQRVELASHAKVTGNLYYNLIEMAMGAEVNGNLVHRVESQPETGAESSAEVIESAGMAAAK